MSAADDKRPAFLQGLLNAGTANSLSPLAIRVRDGGDEASQAYAAYEKAFSEAVGDMRLTVAEDLFRQHQAIINQQLAYPNSAFEHAQLKAKLARNEKDGLPTLIFEDASAAFSGFTEAIDQSALSVFFQDLSCTKRVLDMMQLEHDVCRDVWHGRDAEDKIDQLAKLLYNSNEKLNLLTNTQTAQTVAAQMEHLAVRCKEAAQMKESFIAQASEDLTQVKIRVSEDLFERHRSDMLKAMHGSQEPGAQAEHAQATRHRKLAGAPLLDYGHACLALESSQSNKPRASELDIDGKVMHCYSPRSSALMEAQTTLLGDIWDGKDTHAAKDTLAGLLFNDGADINICPDKTSATRALHGLCEAAKQTKAKALGAGRA